MLCIEFILALPVYTLFIIRERVIGQTGRIDYCEFGSRLSVSVRWGRERSTAGAQSSVQLEGRRTCVGQNSPQTQLQPGSPPLLTQTHLASFSVYRGGIFCKWLHKENMTEDIWVRRIIEERSSICRRSFAFGAFVFPYWMSWTFWILFFKRSGIET